MADQVGLRPWTGYLDFCWSGFVHRKKAPLAVEDYAVQCKGLWVPGSMTSVCNIIVVHPIFMRVRAISCPSTNGGSARHLCSYAIFLEAWRQKAVSSFGWIWLLIKRSSVFCSETLAQKIQNSSEALTCFCWNNLRRKTFLRVSSHWAAHLKQD